LARSKQSSTPFPTREQLLAFIKDNAGKAGTREIARAFGLKNADRAELKRVLRDLSGKGAVETRRKKHHQPGTLPSVTLADIVERDRDGELVAVPTEWDEEAHGESPRILVASLRRAKPGETAGVGDRALLRVERLSEQDGRATYTGRVIKVLDRAKKRMIGIFRALPSGGGRLIPVDKKSLGRELAIAPHATMDAQDGELVAADVAKEGRFGLPT
jgi:ribonuclease R